MTIWTITTNFDGEFGTSVSFTRQQFETALDYLLDNDGDPAPYAVSVKVDGTWQERRVVLGDFADLVAGEQGSVELICPWGGHTQVIVECHRETA